METNLNNNSQSTNYLHVDENSHFFDDLDQIKRYVEAKNDDGYLKTAIGNTIKNGYILFRAEPGKDKNSKKLLEEKVLYNVLNQISETPEILNVTSAPDEEYLNSLENIGMIEKGWEITITEFGLSMLEMLKNKLEK